MILNGREVVDVELDGVDTRDYPDFCDAYFSHAVFNDTGEDLTDAELEKLTEDNPDVINEMCHEGAF
jgi:hypothetical protein